MVYRTIAARYTGGLLAHQYASHVDLLIHDVDAPLLHLDGAGDYLAFKFMKGKYRPLPASRL